MIFASNLFNNDGFRYRVARKVLNTYDVLFSCIEEAPFFILGNQKSGTTAIAILLADALGISVAIDLKKEINDPVFQLIPHGKISFESFIRRNRIDFSKKIIKEPNLTLFYHELALRYPQAKFLMVVRDPRDNIRSILNRLALLGSQRIMVENLEDSTPEAWRYVLNNSWYTESSTDYIESLCDRWNYMTDIYLNNLNNITLVKYEDFIKAKNDVLYEIAHVFDKPIRNDVSKFLDKQFQSKGNQEINLEDFFGENLILIEDRCKNNMQLLGYSVYK